MKVIITGCLVLTKSFFSGRRLLQRVGRAALFGIIVWGNFPLHAQTTWIGGTGDWTTPADWSTGMVPTSTSFTIINTGSVTLQTSGLSSLLDIDTGGSLTIQNGGTLAVGSGEIVVEGGTLTLAGTTNSAGPTQDSLVLIGGSFVLNETDTATVSNQISGVGTVTQNSGTTVFAGGNNTYTEGTIINGGILEVSFDENLGASTSGITFGGGELLTAVDGFTSSRAITVNSNGGTLAAVTGTTATYGGTATGSGQLTIGDGTNLGTIAFSNTFTFTGMAGAAVPSGTAGNGGGGVIVSSFATLANDGGITGGAGGSATDFSADGAAGGIGGAGAAAASLQIFATLNNSNTLTGGAGGDASGGAGTNASDPGLAGGDGGAGGSGGAGVAGVVAINGDNTITNSGTIIGGAGGDADGGAGGVGGAGSLGGNGGAGGIGGAGGVGVVMLSGTTLTNTGTIAGGTGGTALRGAGGPVGAGEVNGLDGTAGIAGAGGVALTGTGFDTVTNSGIIRGGVSGDGLTQADAIDFSGGGNTLALEAGYSITGNVISTSGSTNGGDTLQLTETLTGGTPGTLDASQLGTQYQGFTNFLVAAPFGAASVNTWTLTGTTTAVTPWTISGSILQVASDGALGNTSGAVTLTQFGELLTTADFSSSRSIIVGSPAVSGTDSGVLAAAAGTTATYSGTISGPGALYVGDGTSTGTVVLTGTDNTYGPVNNPYVSFLSGTVVNSGTLEVAANSTIDLGTGVVTGPLGNGSVAINPGATLDIAAGFSVAINGLAGNPAFDGASASSVTLENGSALELYVGSGTTDEYDGDISTASGATATFTKVGAGTLLLTGSGGINGTFSVSQGEVDVEDFFGEGPFSSGTALQVASGASLVIENDTAVEAGDLVATVGGDGTINLNGTDASLTLAGSSNAGTAFAGVIEGSGGLILDGTGLVQTLSGTNTYTGATEIEAGTLALSGTGSIAQSSGVALASGGTFDLSQATGGVTLQGLIGTGGTVSLGGNALTVSIAGSTIEEYDGSIQDGGINATTGGSLIKTGTGTLILAGASSYTGGTDLQAGELEVGSNTALGSGSVKVEDGTTLTTTGNGTGVTLAIGSYTQENGGQLTLNIYGAHNFDSLQVAGSAALNGTLTLNFDTANLTPRTSQEYTVVTTTGGIDTPVSDLFINPVTDLAALKLFAVGAIEGDNFVVTVKPIQQDFVGLFGNYLTPNQTAIASNLDVYINKVPVDGSFAPIITALDQLSYSPAVLASAFNQLSTLNFGQFTSSTAFNNTSFLTQQFDSYLADHRGADGSFVASAGGLDYSGFTVQDPDYLPGLQTVHSRLLAWNPAPSTGLMSDTPADVLSGVDMKDAKDVGTTSEGNCWNTFLSGNAILAQGYSDSNAGTAHSDMTTAAVQVGADYKVTPNFLIGAMFGYGHTSADLDAIGSTATVDTYSPAVYASFAKNGWYANALGSYGFSNYLQHRNVQIGSFGGTAQSSPSGDQIVGNLDGGYDFHKNGWTFGPTAGVQYVHLDVDGYNETGLPGADLNVNENQADSLRSRLGGQMSYAFQGCGLTFVPHLSASWQHEFLDQSRGITSQFDGLGAGSFSVRTANPSRDSALAEVGMDAQINKTWTVFTDYSVQAGQSNYFGQSIQAGFKIGF